MSAETKTFTLGQILTVTHGRLLCTMGEVYEILDHLTGESLMTHQLPRASREAEPVLLERFPDLASIDVKSVTIETQGDVDKFLASLAVGYGRTRDVAPLDAADHTVIDPIAELKMMRPDMPIIALDPTTGETREF